MNGQDMSCVRSMQCTVIFLPIIFAPMIIWPLISVIRTIRVSDRIDKLAPACPKCGEKTIRTSEWVNQCRYCDYFEWVSSEQRKWEDEKYKKASMGLITPNPDAVRESQKWQKAERDRFQQGIREQWERNRD